MTDREHEHSGDPDCSPASAWYQLCRCSWNSPVDIRWSVMVSGGNSRTLAIINNFLFYISHDSNFYRILGSIGISSIGFVDCMASNAKLE